MWLCYLAADPTPLLFREPAPDAVSLPVLQRPREALLSDRARTAEGERRSGLFFGDREEDVGVDPVACGSFLPDVGRCGVLGQHVDVDGWETIDPHPSVPPPRGSPSVRDRRNSTE